MNVCTTITPPTHTLRFATQCAIDWLSEDSVDEMIWITPLLDVIQKGANSGQQSSPRRLRVATPTSQTILLAQLTRQSWQTYIWRSQVRETCRHQKHRALSSPNRFRSSVDCQRLHKVEREERLSEENVCRVHTSLAVEIVKHYDDDHHHHDHLLHHHHHHYHLNRHQFRNNFKAAQIKDIQLTSILITYVFSLQAVNLSD